MKHFYLISTFFICLFIVHCWSKETENNSIFCLDENQELIEVSKDHINDDFCDCWFDGKDEPNTSACSHIQNQMFTCINEGYKNIQIHSSRYHDGICDCCDGSDEDESIGCENTCKFLNDKHIEEVTSRLTIAKEGNTIMKERLQEIEEKHTQMRSAGILHKAYEIQKELTNYIKSIHERYEEEHKIDIELSHYYYKNLLRMRGETPDVTLFRFPVKNPFPSENTNGDNCTDNNCNENIPNDDSNAVPIDENTISSSSNEIQVDTNEISTESNSIDMNQSDKKENEENLNMKNNMNEENTNEEVHMNMNEEDTNEVHINMNENIENNIDNNIENNNINEDNVNNNMNEDINNDINEENINTETTNNNINEENMNTETTNNNINEENINTETTNNNINEDDTASVDTHAYDDDDPYADNVESYHYQDEDDDYVPYHDDEPYDDYDDEHEDYNNPSNQEITNSFYNEQSVPSYEQTEYNEKHMPIKQYSKKYSYEFYDDTQYDEYISRDSKQEWTIYIPKVEEKEEYEDYELDLLLHTTKEGYIYINGWNRAVSIQDYMTVTKPEIPTEIQQQIKKNLTYLSVPEFIDTITFSVVSLPLYLLYRGIESGVTTIVHHYGYSTPVYKEKDYDQYISTKIPYNFTLSTLPASFFFSSSFWKQYYFPGNMALPPRDITNIFMSIEEKLKENQNVLNKFISTIEDGVKEAYGPMGICLMSQEKQCKELKVGQYIYKVCLFEDASQDSTSLGHWKPWSKDEKEYILLYENGATCWNGPARSLKVNFICGNKEEIIDIREPSSCVYEATMTSPCLCTDNYIHSIEQEL